jgi:phosphatidylserine/phosphatidylglycerophosphate/cardiolipin synthase-like enzyme
MFRKSRRLSTSKIEKSSHRIKAAHAGSSREPSSTVNRSSKAVAIANNDVAIIAWNYNQKIENCLGFAVYRIDSQSKKIALPAWVGFKTENNKEWQPKTTEQWPIQKFVWRDLTADGGKSYQYQIVPMVGKPDDLKPREDLALTSPTISLRPDCGDNIFAYFNRGILSTQSLVHNLPQNGTGTPDYKTLLGRIDQPGDPLRKSLAGDMLTALPLLLERAIKDGGECFCALYELTDTEMEHLLLTSPSVHIILSNTGDTDDENRPARQALHEANIDITDRMLSTQHIGHNKFAVYVDANGTPQAVLTGSTNWTYTGLCAQSNNSIIIESSELAKFYYDYWNKLKDDDSKQAIDFRNGNMQGHNMKLGNKNTNLNLWFSPNTREKSKPAKNPKTPADMDEVFTIMTGAKEAILFLAFQPGQPSIVGEAGTCQSNNPDLFIRGAVTDPNAVQEYSTSLFHRSALPDDPDNVSVRPESGESVVSAAAINDQFAFWQKELLKSSPGAHAIIHDKIVVVDPFSPNCVVITGSHNLGYRASYNNDENLVIIRGNRILAQAYTAHIMDVYDHYRFRYHIQQHAQDAFNGLETDDNWQDKYFDVNSDTRKEIEFWMKLSV